MRRVHYQDTEGRHKVSMIPDTSPDSEAVVGVPIGPPDLSDLGLPLETEVRLSNELYHRGILEPIHALKNRGEVVAAVQSALKVDADHVVSIYLGKNVANGATPEGKGKRNART